MIKVLENERHLPARHYLVEIGSTRKNIPGQGSTKVFTEFLKDKSLGFISVDIDPLNTFRANQVIKLIRNDFMAINELGKNFLKIFSGDIYAVYLDAFDIDEGKHSDFIKSRYFEILNVDISNENSALMHLEFN